VKFIFFKIPKPKQFEYKPIYFQEEDKKEYIQNQSDKSKALIREIYKIRKNSIEKKKKAKLNYKIILIIISLLFLAIYFIYF